MFCKIEEYSLYMKSITITSMYPDKTITGDKFLVGFYKNFIFRTLLYFNIEDLLEEEINLLLLKIYLLKKYFNGNVLYIHALLDEFREDYTYNNQPKYDERFIRLKVDCQRSNFITINLTDLFLRWKNGEIKNNGIMLKGIEVKKNLDIFASSQNNNIIITPKICIEYYNSRCSKCIFTKEDEWEITFDNIGITSNIDISKIYQGSFFITNKCDKNIYAQIEVSGDGFVWVKDGAKEIISGETEILIPYFYGKYYRVKLLADGIGRAKIKFIYQLYK